GPMPKADPLLARTSKTAAAERRRQAAAFHEAGHAVVAHMLEYKVFRISIAPKAGSEGHTSWRSPINKRVVDTLQSGSEADIDKVRYRIDHELIVAMAGALAQKRPQPALGWALWRLRDNARRVSPQGLR